MGEHLNRFARKHEIVPVKMWRENGVEGWLFRDRKNELHFVRTSELIATASPERVGPSEGVREAEGASLSD